MESIFNGGQGGIFASLACRLARCPGQRQMLRQLAFVGVRLRPDVLIGTCLTAARSNPAIKIKKQIAKATRFLMVGREGFEPP